MIFSTYFLLCVIATGHVCISEVPILVLHNTTFLSTIQAMKSNQNSLVDSQWQSRQFLPDRVH